MVVEVLADRQIDSRLDPEGPQLIRRPDARQQQQVRRVIRAGAHDHLTLGAHRLQLVVAQQLDADCPLAVQDDACGERVSQHVDVAARERWMQVRHRRAAAPSVSLRELKPARPLLPGAVVIVGRRDPGVHRRLDARPDQRMHRSAIAHGQRPTDAVVIAFTALVVLRATEVRQHILIAPAGEAHRRPPVVVGAVAAHVDHAVERARAAQHAPPRQKITPISQLRLALAPQPPVRPGLPQLAKRQRHVDHGLAVRRPRLDHRHSNVGILAGPLAHNRQNRRPRSRSRTWLPLCLADPRAEPRGISRSTRC